MAFDLDDIFSYQTFQLVRVRDRRLGLLYYGFSISIFVYILYQIVTEKLYLKMESPSAGSIRANLLEPSSLRNTSVLSYCNTGQAGAMTGVKCAYLPGQVAAPTAEEGAVFVTTRLSVSTYASNASCTTVNLIDGDLPLQPSCIQKPTGSKKSYFLADIEKYTLRVEHTVQGESTGISMRGSEMKGVLVGNKSQVLKEFTADVNRVGDILSVEELLLAASDLNIDAISDGVKTAAKDANNTYRYDGIVLVVYIRYHTANSSWNGDMNLAESIEYEYSVKRVDRAEYKYEEPTYYTDGTSRFGIYNRHGIRIVFKQVGRIGRFDLMSLLVNLVAATALLATAVKAVEFLMLNILPEKTLYREEKIRETKDFSDVRQELKRRAVTPSGSGAPSPTADKMHFPPSAVPVQKSAPFEHHMPPPPAGGVALQMPTPHRPANIIRK